MASKSFPCVACGTEVFSSRAELSKHYSLFHKKGNISCPQCKVEITSMCNLKKHLKTHDSNRIHGFKCSVDQCDKRFYTAADAKKHVAIVHSAEKAFPCPLQCGKRFKTKQEVKIHISSHTKEKPHKCAQCGRPFGQKDSLDKHIKFQHTFRDGKPHDCTQCGMKFKQIYNLQSHILHIHTARTNNFFCSECPKNFFSKSHLIRHSVTLNSKRKLLDCYFCSRKSTTRSNLERHLKRHTTETPFTCREKGCNYFSTQASNLLRHVNDIHYKSPKIRMHTCYFCLATFTDNADLIQHMRIHTLEEPFSCKLCRKSYKTASNIRRHIHAIHTKEKPYKCQQCEKCFSSNDNLKLHTAIHAKKKRFFCEVCSYSSQYSGYFKRHCEKLHRDKN